MRAYIDTSVVLRILLQDRNRLLDISQFTELYSLELVETECLRVFHRLRLQGGLDDATFSDQIEKMYEFLSGLQLIELNRTIFKRAGQAFSTVLGTLDALHLSAAIGLFQAFPADMGNLLTHDIQLGRAAKSIGALVLGIGLVSKSEQ